MNTADLAERYVAGRMGEDEEQRFEIAMLEQPDLAAEVDARQRIKAGLQRLEERGELAALTSQSTRRNLIRYAAAACVLLAIGAFLVLWKPPAKSGAPFAGSLLALVGADSTNTAVSGTYLLASTRARPDETVIDVKDGTSAVRLQVIRDADDSQPLIASLERVSDAGAPVVIGEARVMGTSAGQVDVFLNPGALGSGRYALHLKPESAADAAEDYAFTLKVGP